jgi:N-acetylneuraminate lyase
MLAETPLARPASGERAMIDLTECKRRFSGVYSALFTAYDDKGNVSPERLRRLIDFQLERGLRGAFITGSTGEGLLLTDEERKRVAETTVAALKGRGLSIVHVGHTSPRAAVELARHAESIGADMVSSVPPIYYSVGPEGVLLHYRQIAESVKLPVLVYNIPATTGVTFSDELRLKLFEIPNVVGMKYTAPDLFYMRNIIELLDERALVLSGSDEMFLPALVMGCNGSIGTTQNVAPEWFVRIHQSFLAGDLGTAQELQFEVNRFIKFWLSHGRMAGIKAAAVTRGVPVGDVRPPLPPGTAHDLAAMEQYAHEFFTRIPKLAPQASQE